MRQLSIIALPGVSWIWLHPLIHQHPEPHIHCAQQTNGGGMYKKTSILIFKASTTKMLCLILTSYDPVHEHKTWSFIQVNAGLCKVNTLFYLRVHHCTGVVTDRCRSPLSHIGQLQPSSQHTVVITLAAVLVLAVAKLGGHWCWGLRTAPCRHCRNLSLAPSHQTTQQPPICTVMYSRKVNVQNLKLFPILVLYICT